MGRRIKTTEEIIGVKPKQEEKRLTFSEWCREIELQNNTVFYWNNGVPQHKLKDPSMDDKILKSQIEVKVYREFLDLVERISNIKIKMPEGNIEYKP